MSLNPKLSFSDDSNSLSPINSNHCQFIDALSVQHKKRGMSRIRSGISELDGLLRGGIELGLFTLFYGANRINQVLLRLSVSAQLPPNYGGLTSPVIFIDANNMFNPFEVASIARRYGLDPNHALKNIHVVRAFNFPMLVDVLSNQLPQKIASCVNTPSFTLPMVNSFSSSPCPPKLILISGIAPQSFDNRVMNETRGAFSKAIGWIKSMAMEHEIAVVASAPLASNSQRKPAGGTILQHTSQVQIFVRKAQDRIEYCLLKHPSRPSQKVTQWQISPALSNYTLDLFMNGDPPHSESNE